jgi:predicted DNA binding CopG/RHH family protein
MEQITLKVPRDVLESIDEEAESEDISRSEYLRTVLESRHDVDDIRADYEERIDDLEAAHAEELEQLTAEHEDREATLQARIDDLQERVSDLRDEREEFIRADARVDVLEDELERVREERDEAMRRAERNEQKLALHSSEKSRWSRFRGWLSG